MLERLMEETPRAGPAGSSARMLSSDRYAELAAIADVQCDEKLWRFEDDWKAECSAVECAGAGEIGRAEREMVNTGRLGHNCHGTSFAVARRYVSAAR